MSDDSDEQVPFGEPSCSQSHEEGDATHIVPWESYLSETPVTPLAHTAEFKKPYLQSQRCHPITKAAQQESQVDLGANMPSPPPTGLFLRGRAPPLYLLFQGPTPWLRLVIGDQSKCAEMEGCGGGGE